MKKLTRVLLIIGIVYIVLLKSFLNSINHERKYQVKEVDSLLTEIEEKYHFVKGIEAFEKRGEIIVRIEYAGHQDININNTLKEGIKEGFSRSDVMKSMLCDTDDRIYLTIEFIDIINMISHEMRTEIYFKDDIPIIGPWYK